MSKETSNMSKIEWTEKTWNPVTGCTKISEACKNCYAEVMAKRLSGMPASKEKYRNGFWNGSRLKMKCNNIAIMRL